MSDAVISALLNAGILGPVLICMGWYVLKRDAENQKKLDEALQRELAANIRALEAQQKRVEDAQAVAGTLLALNDRWQGVINEVVRTTGATNQTMERIRETLDKVWDRLHLPRST